MRIRLAVLRHAKTEWNEKGLYQGRRDLPLSTQGKIEMASRALPSEFQGWAFFSSPLLRARETAKFLTDQPVTVVPEATEVDFGDWEATSIEENKNRRKLEPPRFGKWGWDDRPPHGESYREVRARILPFLRRLNQDSVLIAHRGVIVTLAATAWSWDLESKWPAKLKNDCWQVFEWDVETETLSFPEPNRPW